MTPAPRGVAAEPERRAAARARLSGGLGHRLRPSPDLDWPGGRSRRPCRARGGRTSFFNVHVPYTRGTSLLHSGMHSGGFAFIYFSSSAAASLADFNTKYLGAHATAPTGTAAGQQYFNTTSDTMFVYTGSSWTEAGSAVNGTSNRVVVTATAAQTNFSISYDVGYVDVYLNGSKLQAGTDFTATNGATVVLTSGAAAGDIVDMVAYGAFNVANVYTQTESDARFAQLSNNLSDLASASTALTNLGVTSTAAELNVLDGIPATLTPTEIGYVDGVTSAIQTQLDAKGTGTVSNLADLSITSTAAEINKLDALSRGSLIYGNASAETALLTKGTANQVLTSDGTDIAWADAAAGGTSGMQVLSTVTASNSATVDLETTFDSTYDDYIIMISDIVTQTDQTDLYMQYKVGGSYITSGYSTAQVYNGFPSSGVSVESTGGATSYILVSRALGNTYNEVGMFKVNISNVHDTGRVTPAFIYGASLNGYAGAVGGFSYGTTNQTGAVTGVRFKMSSGNIATGNFRLYGVAKS